MKTLTIQALMITVLILAFVTMAPVDANSSVGLIVARFDGNGALAKNVQAVLHLMIWQTLRKAPTPNPQKLDFGESIIEWADYDLDSQSHSAAEKLATDIKLQMTLWGNVLPYGDGVVVQTNLSIPRYDDGRIKQPEIWIVSLRAAGQDYRIEADIPRRYYEFAPIILTSEVVRTYSSPGAVKMYRNKDMIPPPIGILGDYFKAIRHEGDKVLVVSKNTGTGWIHLPKLSSQRNEVVDFAGGLIRVYRGDWDGAFDLMKRVIRNQQAPTTLKVDAYLFQALAKTRQGKSPDEELRKAHELSPYSSAVVIYDIMNDLEQLSRDLLDSNEGGNVTEKAKSRARLIEDKVKENRYLFPENDVWLKSVIEVAERVR
jgi:hypothetical protein